MVARYVANVKDRVRFSVDALSLTDGCEGNKHTALRRLRNRFESYIGYGALKLVR